VSKEKSSLGRGLDSLLGERKEAPKNNTPNEISLDQLTPGEFQPRTKMHKETLEELADSIKNQGVLQPLLVREKASGRYEIIAGERRWRAAQIAGLKSVPVSIKKVNNNDAAKIALVENLQREDLNAMDQSRGLQRLQMEFNLSQEELAKSIGKSRSAVTNLLRLSKLNKKVQGYLESGEIEMGHARALLGVDGDTQVALAEEIIKQSLSVREAEKLASRKKTIKKSVQKTTKDPNITSLERELSEDLGAGVRIQSNKSGKGKLTIEFKGLGQLEGILEKLRKK
jgi:ParB family chromosome partitioning protein